MLSNSQAVQGLPGDTSVRTKIGIKMIGEIDPKVFLNMCKQKYPKEDAEAESAILRTKWQKEINNAGWNPFKIVVVNGKELVRIVIFCLVSLVSAQTLCRVTTLNM